MEKFEINILGCGAALPTPRRLSSSQIVNIREKLFMLDCAEGAQMALRRSRLSFSHLQAIFLTHLHGDHIGGLLKDGQPVFPQAKLYIPSAELDAWKESPNVQALVAAYGERLVKFAPGEALPCGVQALPAYGHTPGHTLYLTDDKLIAGDIMHGIALQLEHPEYCARYDMDKERAIASRKSVLERVKQEGWTLYGMHFPTADGVKVK